MAGQKPIISGYASLIRNRGDYRIRVWNATVRDFLIAGTRGGCLWLKMQPAAWRDGTTAVHFEGNIQ
jgi:hypothetical protein